jgi:cytochrome c-type biogenesis protein CcmF
LGCFTAIAHFFRYKKTPRGLLLRQLTLPLILSFLVAVVFTWLSGLDYTVKGSGFMIALYAGFFSLAFAVIANGHYVIAIMKGRLAHAGGAITHIGFGLMIAGMIFTSSNKKTISDSRVNGINLPVGVDPMTKKQDDPRENLTLLRDIPTTMGNYRVTYMGDSAGQEANRVYYKLRFEDTASQTSFYLKPDVYVMKDNTMSSNPDTRSYFSRDVFTYITNAIDQSKNQDTSQFVEYLAGPGEKVFTKNGYFLVEEVAVNPSDVRFNLLPSDTALVARLRITKLDTTTASQSTDSTRFLASPLFKIANMSRLYVDDTLYAQNMIVRFIGVEENRKIRIGIKESDRAIDFIAVKSYVFPQIAWVWIGLIIMAMGILVSLLKKVTLPDWQKIALIIVTGSALLYVFLFANQ